MSKFILTTICVLFSIWASAQLNLDFLQHLRNENMQIEEITYINSLHLPAKQLSLLTSDYYLRYKLDSSFLETYQSVKNEFQQDSNRMALASAYFLSRKTIRKKWFEQNNLPVENVRLTEVFNFYKNVQQGKQMNITTLPDPLHQSYTVYQKAHKRSPLLAASLSAVVPGLGKAYNGKHRRFLATLLTNGMLSYQTYESIKKLGPKHALSITNMIIASVFYLSNVYGSYHDIQLFKRESKNQLLLDASNFYSSEFRTD